MKIPPKVRITHRVSYEVVYSDLIDGDPEIHGQCWYQGRQIRLKNGLSESELLRVFIHELLHAIEFESGETVPHAAIEILDRGILRVLRLNRWL